MTVSQTVGSQPVSCCLPSDACLTLLSWQADALIGCFRFVEGYYLLFVTQKNLIGSICGKSKSEPQDNHKANYV